MSLRAVFKSKFKHEGHKEDVAISSHEKEDIDEDIVLVDSAIPLDVDKGLHDTSAISQELYLSKLAELTDSLNEHNGHKDWSTSDKEVFEVQLSNLQEQLVAAMIENQTINEELQKYKETSMVDKLQQELEYEQEKNKMLMEKFEEMESQSHRNSSQSNAGEVELARDVLDGGEDMKVKVEKVLERKGEQSKFLAWFLAIYYNFISDFTDLDEEEEVPESKDGDPLTVKKSSTRQENLKDIFCVLDQKEIRMKRVHDIRWLSLGEAVTAIVRSYDVLVAYFSGESKSGKDPTAMGILSAITTYRLKENIKRFSTCTKPILNFIKVIGVILRWRAPITSLLFFSVYMYSVWHGWLATVLLGTLLYWLSKNYVMSKGWHVDICILPYDFIDEDNDSDKALGMSDKFQLVLQVARKVQNLMGKAADSLEKLKNLVMWEHPESTRKLYFFCCVAFVASIFLPGKLLFKITGLFLGVKLFVINSVYRKFPRVKRRYDSMVKIWKELPTDAELKTRMQMAEREQYMLPTSSSNTSLTSGSQLNRSQTAQAVLSGENQAFCRLFSLPPAEAPLPDWHGGKRCTLISKEKTLTGAFKNGKLYLTRSFLCFERSKYPTPKNLVIPLADITSLEKAKPYGFLPGGGMAIEIGVSGCDKPYIFGAMINRDEAYESIIRAAQQACLAWAIEDDEVTPSETSTFDS